jgi:hypothetical protein
MQHGYIRPIEKMNAAIGTTKFPDFALVTHDNYLDVLENQEVSACSAFPLRPWRRTRQSLWLRFWTGDCPKGVTPAIGSGQTVLWLGVMNFGARLGVHKNLGLAEGTRGWRTLAQLVRYAWNRSEV